MYFFSSKLFLPPPPVGYIVGSIYSIMSESGGSTKAQTHLGGETVEREARVVNGSS